MLSFINNKYDCYLNSVLQALFNTHSFSCFFRIKRSDENLIIQMFRIIYEYNSLVNPCNIKKLLSQFDSSARDIFGNNDQQDAHEAIVKIIDIIHMSSCYRENNFSDYGIIDSEIKNKSLDAWKSSIDKLGFSFITRFFSGQFKTLLKCKKCEYENITWDNFNNINLSITGEDIIDCFSDFVKPEIMHDAKCEKCGTKSLIKTTTIWKFPLTMVLNIKRFSFNTQIQKNNKSLVLNKNLRISGSGRIYNYCLTSVVYHIGSSPNSGHYYTDILKYGTWYKVDDERITKLSDIVPESNNCYIMIYNYE